MPHFWRRCFFAFFKASKKEGFFFNVQNLETVRGYESANLPVGSTHEYYQTPQREPVWAFLSPLIFFCKVKKVANFDQKSSNGRFFQIVFHIERKNFLTKIDFEVF